MLEAYVKTLRDTPDNEVTHLVLSHMKLCAFPAELLRYAPYVTRIELNDNALTHLPKELAQFSQLEICFVSNNPITHIDTTLSQLSKLRILGCKSCAIAAIDENALPTSLQWLILTNNHLTSLPHSIGTLTRLKKVMLAGNALSELPQSFAACQEIELLRLSANQFRALPPAIEALKRLAWFAFGGNPCTPPVKPLDETLNTTIKLPVALGEKLGEGASGTIYHATSSHGDVAVKCFKGEVTSDGYADDEFIASMHAPKHPNLLSAQYLAATNKCTKALAMTLLHDDYTLLADPPSLQSCTRDCYNSERILSDDEAVRIIKEMANALLALHEQQIMHGDFYAHNIHIATERPTKLGDFGAAFSYAQLPNDALFQTIEQRALKTLIAELQPSCKESAQHLLSEISSQNYDNLKIFVEFINKL